MNTNDTPTTFELNFFLSMISIIFELSLLLVQFNFNVTHIYVLTRSNFPFFFAFRNWKTLRPL